MQGQGQIAPGAFQQPGAGGQGGFPQGPPPQGTLPQDAPGTGQSGGGTNVQLVGLVANGQIKSVNGNTLEISTADSVVRIKVSDQTIITKSDRETIGDMKAGDRVSVYSQETGDTSTASWIQVQRGLPVSTLTPAGQ